MSILASNYKSTLPYVDFGLEKNHVNAKFVLVGL